MCSIQRLSIPQTYEKMNLRKLEFENFKRFLNENDAIVFYKLWLEIERIKQIKDLNERQQ